MAKLFYTIDEAAAKLQKSQAELRAMVDSGQLEEFKMHEVTHFKKAVIDQLVSDDLGDIELALKDDDSPPPPPLELNLDLNENSGSAVLDELKFDEEPAAPPPIPSSGGSDAGAEPDLLDLDLADSGISASLPPLPTTAGASASAASGSAGGLDLGLDLGLDDSTAKPQSPDSSASAAPPSPASDSGSGIALNDMSGSMVAPPPRAQTQRPVAADGSSVAGDDLSLEPTSDRLDDSADADASSISAALLDDGADSFDGGGSLSADTDLFAPTDNADGDAFANADASAPITAAAAPTRAGAPAMITVETVDGAASGLGIGLMAGALASIIVAALIVVGTRSSGGSALASEITGDNMLLWLGGLAGGTLLFGGIGFFVGKSIDG
jgi:hypothetical protein